MIARDSSHWKGSAGDRKPLLPAGQVESLGACADGKSPAWGKVTSRPRPSQRDIEHAAYLLQTTVANVLEAMRQGML
jgi:hypothetical protein